MKTLYINNYQFNYLEKGDGSPVVLVHGSVSDYRTWTNQLNSFQSTHQVFAYSRRFHWPNEKIKPGQDYDMLRHVSDLEEIIKIINQPIHLVGHSYGAFICLLLAMRSVENIRSMVIAEPPIITLYVSNNPRPGELIKLLFHHPKIALAILKFGINGMIPAGKAISKNDLVKAVDIFGKATLGATSYSNLSQKRKDQVFANLIKEEFLGSGFPPISRKKLMKLDLPVLLISGQNSPTLFKLLIDQLDALLPDSTKKTIPNASHISHEDNPEAYNQTVLSFFENFNNT